MMKERLPKIKAAQKKDKPRDGERPYLDDVVI